MTATPDFSINHADMARARSGRQPGKDGRTVEAQVDLSGRLSLMMISQPPGHWDVFRPDDICLQLVVSPVARGRIDHGKRFDADARRGDCVLAPANVDLGYSVDTDLRKMVAICPRSTIATLIGGEDRRSVDFGKLHEEVFRDDTIRILMQRLWREFGVGESGGALLAEGLWMAVCALLAEKAQTSTRSRRVAVGDWRVRRVAEMLLDAIDRDIGLVEAATAVDLHPRQLSNLFRRHFGCPPHRWLLERRIDRAEVLLRETARPVTQIALECGFSSSQHFATAFRARHGVAPGVFRRE